MSCGRGREFRAACATGMQLRDKKRVFPNGRKDKRDLYSDYCFSGTNNNPQGNYSSF